MNSTKTPYPSMPMDVKQDILNPSPEFKKEVVNVCLSIIFFLIVYFLLVIASVLLAAACAAGGISLIIFLPKFITIMVGIGLAGIGVMVMFFLIKFIFKQHKTDRSGLIEIKEKDQPVLFSFIRRITEETQTPFPKKIYLSPDVNACVFYDSGFWSMFFPVKKNLQIGLGLVNAINISEFKAILAHEFGHFSQRSMKLGSYVYNVNQIIYNLLYDNEGYGKALDNWANMSGYFAFFAGITIKIVQGIQIILQKVYSLVNKRYMSLSRQMEFHADSVAAYVTGADHLVSSLYRLEAADICYNNLFTLYNTWLKENYKSDNIYPQHKELMLDFAQKHKIKIENELPIMNSQSLAFFKQSRLVIKDQWASHPDTIDREKHLNSLNIHTPALHDSAWVVFENPEELQQRMTNKIYEASPFKGSPIPLPLAAFKEKYTVYMEENNFHVAYKGYYDNRNISPFEPNEIIKNTKSSSTLESLLTDEIINLPPLINGLESDIQTLEVIAKGDSGIKTFDYDGKKFKDKDALQIKERINLELTELKKKVSFIDQEIFKMAYEKKQSDQDKEELISQYQTLFHYNKALEDHLNEYKSFMDLLQPLYYGNMEYEEAQAQVRLILQREMLVKPIMKELLEDHNVQSFIPSDDLNKIKDYSEREFQYLNSSGFINESLEKMQVAWSIFIETSDSRCFRAKKKLLENQLV